MKGYRLYMLVGALLVTIYLIAQYNKPVVTDWTPTYLKKDKIPFGTYILFHQLPDIIPHANVRSSNLPVYNTLKGKNYKQSSYFIISNQLKVDKYDLEQLKNFARAGNSVFIATYDFGALLEKEFNISTRSAFLLKKGGGNAGLNFTNENLRSELDYSFDKEIGMQYFKKIDTTRAIVLSENRSNYPNFLKYSYNNGAIYLIAEPGFYSNYNLLKENGAEYAAKTLSYVKGNPNIIWDEYFTGGREGETDLMRVFFKHPELKYAYYIAVFGILAFVLFEIKRRQRIIPVLDPLNNASVEFAGIVSSLYYQERDNLNIAQKKANYFMEHLRNRYFIRTNAIDLSFIEVLVHKTGIDEIFARVLTKQIIALQSKTEVNDTELIKLNESIEQFYRFTQG